MEDILDQRMRYALCSASVLGCKSRLDDTTFINKCFLVTSLAADCTKDPAIQKGPSSKLMVTSISIYISFIPTESTLGCKEDSKHHLSQNPEVA